MPHTISHKTKLPLLACACALAIALAPANVLAAGGGGHAGGFGAMTASPAMSARPIPSPVGSGPARPIVAPPDRPANPDMSSHAPLQHTGTPTPVTSSPTAATGSPTPVAGTRLPIEPSAPRRDPPPQD